MLHVAMKLSSDASIAAVRSKYSVDTVGDDASSSLVYTCCLLLFMQVHPFIFPSFFLFDQLDCF